MMLDQEERKDGDLLLEDRPSSAPVPARDAPSGGSPPAPADAEPQPPSSRLAIDQPGWSAQVKARRGAGSDTPTLTMPADPERRQSLIAARVRTTAAPRQPFPPLPPLAAADVSAATLESTAEVPTAEAAESPASAPAEPAAAAPEPAAEEVSPYLAAARRAAEAARARAARIRTTSPEALPPPPFQPLQPLAPAPRAPAPRPVGWLERGLSVEQVASAARIGFRPLTGSERVKPYRTEYQAAASGPPAPVAARIVSASPERASVGREERFRRLAREIEAQQRRLGPPGRDDPLSHAQPDEEAEGGLWRRWSRRLAGG